MNQTDEARECIEQHVSANGHKVVCPFLKSHGKFFTPMMLPGSIRVGRVQQCYDNSFRLLKRHGERLQLSYAEGYATSEQCPLFPTFHAWCVDEDGNVYDPTWKTGVAYFGIAFKSEYIFDTMKQRERAGNLYPNHLDDWKNDFPLIEQLGDHPDIWKHVGHHPV